MKPIVLMLSAALLAACATSPAVYGPASREGALGYTSQQIETGRHRVSYTDDDPVKARNLALLRAAEITLMEGRQWFEVTAEFADAGPPRRSGGSSISIGGGTGSYGRSSSVGVGVGIGIPLGGGSAGSGRVTSTLEIVTGSGEKPDRPTVYDARSVDMNLRGSGL
ncbi:CC0125/CC1285 family lipoprotein [Hyphomonas sp.]|uniref:CC0125/CC1285 family lipoprotein n=1 Tax=Hyphomonas sp. TaxID=87 RepID=UPI00391B5DD5